MDLKVCKGCLFPLWVWEGRDAVDKDSCCISQIQKSNERIDYVFSTANANVLSFLVPQSKTETLFSSRALCTYLRLTSFTLFSIASWSLKQWEYQIDNKSVWPYLSTLRAPLHKRKTRIIFLFTSLARKKMLLRLFVH